ncbi:MAG: type II toxin-antitoxin system PemK/MazF family toxin [Rhodoferax sp.]|nr:type II toxin-antitoxin system PemK/MazF family toxin [Rhodoferax sp.]
MAIKFQPAPGTILNCDFHGFIVPEIVKTRQVVVLWKHKSNARLVYVVPLSTTAPHDPSLALELAGGPPILRQGQDQATRTWVKCDMVYTVSTERLSMPVNRASRRTASAPININISTPDLMAVRKLVAMALRLV